MASRVRLTLSDTELIHIFIGTLQGLYYENIVGSLSFNFVDIVVIRERIEGGIKSRKISSTDNQQSVAKKPQSGFTKKKEREASDMTTNVTPQFQVSVAPMPYYPYPYVAEFQYQQQPQYQQPP